MLGLFAEYCGIVDLQLTKYVWSGPSQGEPKGNFDNKVIYWDTQPSGTHTEARTTWGQQRHSAAAGSLVPLQSAAQQPGEIEIEMMLGASKSFKQIYQWWGLLQTPHCYIAIIVVGEILCSVLRAK